MNRIVYPAVFLASFFLFLHTMHPAFKLDDSPETVAVAVNLGVQHPPGYPLATMLDSLAAHLGPGGIYIRINIFSAALGASCAVLVASIVHSLFPSAAGLAGGAAAGLMLCASEMAWESALSAKGGIYLLNLALILLAIRVLGRGTDPFSRRSFTEVTAAFFILGLGMANHWMSAVWWLPVLILHARPWNAHRVLKAALAMAPGISLYLSLPLSASRQPAWGIPDTAGRLVEVVLRADFMQAVSRKAVSSLPIQFAWGVFFPLREAGVLFLLAAVAGAALLFILRRAAWKFLFAGSLLTILAVSCSTNPRHPLTDEMSLWLTDRFFFPYHAVMAICFGTLAAFLMSLSSRAIRAAVLASAAAVIGLSLAGNFGRNDHSRDYLGSDFAENVAIGMERDAVIFAEADFQTFPLFARALVDFRVPPAEIIVTNPFLNNDWGWRALEKSLPAAGDLRRTRGTRTQKIENLMDLAGRPGRVYHMFLCSYPAIKARLQMHGIVYRLLPRGEKPELLGEEETMNFFRRARMRGLYSPRPHKDRMVESVTDIYILALAMPGEKHHQAGDHTEAIHHYRRALRIPGALGRAMVLSQLGHTAASALLYGEAEQAFREAAHIIPSNLNFWTNLGTACAAQGKIEEAYRYLRYVLRENPGHPAAQANLANLEDRLAQVRSRSYQ